MADFIQRIKDKTPSGLKDAAKSALTKAQPFADKATAVATVGVGVIGASLSRLADIPFDPSQVTRLTSAMANHGISAVDAVRALPDELTKYGTQVVDQYLKGGDPQGKQWSHVESQLNNPDRASDPNNGIWDWYVKEHCHDVDPDVLSHVRAALTGIWLKRKLQFCNASWSWMPRSSRLNSPSIYSKSQQGSSRRI